MKNLDWRQLHILGAVLETSSLSAAARRLGVSQPTVSRQLRALEKDLDEALVEVTPDGSHPTAAALLLAPALREMMRAASSIGSLQLATTDTPVVRVTCGPWIAAMLSKNIQCLLGEPSDIEIEIVSSIAFADLPRRQADIAIRNQRPTDKRLALKRLPDYACAAYGALDLVGERDDAFDTRRFLKFDWAALVEELDHFPTARWLTDRLRKNPVARFSTSVNLLDAVKGGSVLAVVPCFIGDPEENLVRVSDSFVPDYGGHWIVMDNDARRRPHVRRAADRIVTFLQEREAQLLPN
ncbi:MAG: LysR family transcriptional regulator [Gammaproteobacteria bacterium]|nr:LysR family transcriptional regulator [Gammaproteobacteria bacterium]